MYSAHYIYMYVYSAADLEFWASMVFSQSQILFTVLPCSLSKTAHSSSCAQWPGAVWS